MAYKGWTNYSTWRLASLLNTTADERTNVLEMASQAGSSESLASGLKEMYHKGFSSFFESRGVEAFMGLTLEHLEKVNWTELSEAIMAELKALGPDNYGGPEADDPDSEELEAKKVAAKKKDAPVAEAEEENEAEDEGEDGDEEEEAEGGEDEAADDDIPETEDHLHSADQIVDLEDAVEKIVAEYEAGEKAEEEGEGDDLAADDLGDVNFGVDYEAPVLDNFDM